ncbi:hypothetical protein AVEN_163925-1 [Araneus ventricosus]|uniref:Uncharacterized protein n=1 Tax=Araneus ventricosus TaxID=182803 RepID=A0A4Y2W034_ARAVE|nr:hypothetical protein AVEN_163925-1 [Araneus ventricosus]
MNEEVPFFHFWVKSGKISQSIHFFKDNAGSSARTRGATIRTTTLPTNAALNPNYPDSRTESGTKGLMPNICYAAAGTGISVVSGSAKHRNNASRIEPVSHTLDMGYQTPLDLSNVGKYLL